MRIYTYIEKKLKWDIKNQSVTIEVVCFWVINIDGNNFPVSFTFINHSQYAQDFHFNNFSTWAYLYI